MQLRMTRRVESRGEGRWITLDIGDGIHGGSGDGGERVPGGGNSSYCGGAENGF